VKASLKGAKPMNERNFYFEKSVLEIAEVNFELNRGIKTLFALIFG